MQTSKSSNFEHVLNIIEPIEPHFLQVGYLTTACNESDRADIRPPHIDMSKSRVYTSSNPLVNHHVLINSMFVP